MAQKSRLLSDWLYVKHRSVVTEKKRHLAKMKSSSVKNQVKCEICNDCMIFGQPISRNRKREFGFDSYNGFY